MIASASRPRKPSSSRTASTSGRGTTAETPKPAAVAAGSQLSGAIEPEKKVETTRASSGSEARSRQRTSTPRPSVSLSSAAGSSGEPPPLALRKSVPLPKSSTSSAVNSPPSGTLAPSARDGGAGRGVGPAVLGPLERRLGERPLARPVAVAGAQLRERDGRAHRVDHRH